MNKLRMHTIDGVENNVAKIAALFPNCVTEAKDEQGNLRNVVNYDKLKVELGEVVEGPEERFQFTWPGKRDAIRLANAPIAAALRPAREDSVDFDSTHNLYIESDNLDVLKLLRETYLGKVKMIYIDPPYNTGNDFVYEDDFSQTSETYLTNSGQYDDQGNRLVTNTENNGRFHTDWLNMIYPRLKVARDLLTEDGVIFISIDDNEIENLRKVCDEIFGESNFVAQMVWQGGKTNTAKFISTSHEYILIFAKSMNYCSKNNVLWREKKRGLDAIYSKCKVLLESTGYDYEEATRRLKEWYRNEAPEECRAHEHYCNIDENGIYCMDNVSRVGGGKYSVVNPINGITINPPSRGWVFGKEEDFWKAVESGKLVFQDNANLPILKRYLHDNELQLLDTVFYKDRRGARLRLRQLLGGDIFDFPKDETVLSNLVDAFTNETDLICDFFSGSATTAHAVMQLNAENGSNRKFIMVQIPEATESNSEAFKAGYSTICEIGKERIRRAGMKIKDEHPEANNLDTGFRVLRLDSSNMEDVYYTPEELDPGAITGLLDNVKQDRTDEDLLIQVMLELDIPLSASIKREQIAGKHLFNVADGHLIATFDRDVNETTVTEIAKQHPNYFVMRDASAANDNVLDNFEQIFRHYSPDTICKIL